jgi:hypothetical protein
MLLNSDKLFLKYKENVFHGRETSLPAHISIHVYIYLTYLNISLSWPLTFGSADRTCPYLIRENERFGVFKSLWGLQDSELWFMCQWVAGWSLPDHLTSLLSNYCITRPKKWHTLTHTHTHTPHCAAPRDSRLGRRLPHLQETQRRQAGHRASAWGHDKLLFIPHFHPLMWAKGLSLPENSFREWASWWAHSLTLLYHHLESAADNTVQNKLILVICGILINTP